MNDLYKINMKDKLYVKNSDKGYFCMGFDNVDRIGKGLAKELSVKWEKVRKGTKKHYNQYCKMVDLASKKHIQNGFRSETCLTKSFKGLEGKRIKVTLKNAKQKRFWVGHSTGFIPCHLMVPRIDSTGGGAVCFKDEEIDHIEILRHEGR